MDTEDSTALCMPESECRKTCALLTNCYGIDMWTGGDRCSRGCHALSLFEHLHFFSNLTHKQTID